MNNGKICVSVFSKTADDLFAKISRGKEQADIVEVRFDFMEKKEIDKALKLADKNWLEYGKLLLATFRPLEQGGMRTISKGERQDFWFGGNERPFLSGDIEEDIIDDGYFWFWPDPICSYHDLSGVAANAGEIYGRLSATRAATLKIAVATNDICDAISVWNLIDHGKADQKKIIPIAMGEAGKWTRILGLAHGAFLTYASLGEGMETADGQITAKDMIEVYRVKELDLDTKVYGVIGDPVSGSLSPYFHNPAFIEQDINAVFIPLQVKDLDEFMRRMVRPETREVELNFSGFAVTMPHKQAIIKLLDAIDPTAERIGAVNTVKIDSGKMTGYNTDAYGFITPLKAKFGDLKDARVALFGAGGAARACVFALIQENADVTVVARNNTSGKQMADEFDIRFEHLTIDHRPLATDIVVNATPLGMKGPLENESLFIADDLKGVKFVYDLVTMPADTPLIREAKKANIPAIGGVEMLIHQGVKQFEIWTGQAAPLERMKEAIFKKIDRTRE